MMKKIIFFLGLLGMIYSCKDDNSPETKKTGNDNPFINHADYSISNDVLTVGISERDGGAVCTMVYDGVELVNDHDHGRQI